MCMATKAKPRQQVLEQVRKLLALADRARNSSEHEATAALDAAHRILDQYGLDVAEIHAEQDTEWDIVDWTDDPRSQYDTWNKHLGFAASNLFNCQSYISRRGWNKTGQYRLVSVGFIGESTDVAMVREVWPWLVKQARKLARQYAGPGWDARHRTFAEAFATRIWLRSEEMREADLAKKKADRTAVKPDGTTQDISTALVVTQKTSAIQTWMDNQGIKFKEGRARRANGEYHHNAAMAGDSAGSSINLDFAKQVGGSSSKQVTGE